jgi:hypothetical protein
VQRAVERFRDDSAGAYLALVISAFAPRILIIYIWTLHAGVALLAADGHARDK